MDFFDGILEWALNGTTLVLASSHQAYLIEKVQLIRIGWYNARENVLTPFIFTFGVCVGILFMFGIWILNMVLR